MAGRQIRRQVASALVGAAMIFSRTAALPDDQIRPVSGPWEAGKFEFHKKQKKTRQALSGIACPGKPGSGSACLVVFDEGTIAHYVVLSPDGYTIDNTEVSLIDSDGELDAEAAATDGTFYYVTGSHSTKRGDCQSNPDSRHLIRFAVGADGKGIDAGGRLVEYKETDALWRLMKSRSELKDHVGKCLGAEQEGINIEGLAIKDGTLHVGFRAPTADGTVPILSVDAKAVFESAEPPTQITMLRIGKGRGVRDLAVVHDGILVLAGPDDDDANPRSRLDSCFVGWRATQRIDNRTGSFGEVGPFEGRASRLRQGAEAGGIGHPQRRRQHAGCCRDVGRHVRRWTAEILDSPLRRQTENPTSQRAMMRKARQKSTKRNGAGEGNRTLVCSLGRQCQRSKGASFAIERPSWPRPLAPRAWWPSLSFGPAPRRVSSAQPRVLPEH
jgi:Protein of unknown function (DUF3616)